MTEKAQKLDELQVDRVGVKYAYNAGYDPQVIISFLNKVKER